MPTLLQIVRHGQTQWNKEDRFRGRSDLPLTKLGVRQAEAVAKRLARDYRPSALLASPLCRALQTAEPIARRLRLQVRVDGGLLDVDYGEFTGLSRPEAEAEYPNLYASWLAEPERVHFPGGESFAEVQGRARDLVDRLSKMYPNQEVVLTTHLVVCRILLVTLLGLNSGYFETFEIRPGSLSILEWDGAQARVVTVNDCCHLREVEKSDHASPVR